MAIAILLGTLMLFVVLRLRGGLDWPPRRAERPGDSVLVTTLAAGFAVLAVTSVVLLMLSAA